MGLIMTRTVVTVLLNHELFCGNLLEWNGSLAPQ
jgi:hypothetical protein